MAYKKWKKKIQPKEMLLDKETKDTLDWKIKDKMDEWNWMPVGVVKWEAYDATMDEDKQAELILNTTKELESSEEAMSSILSDYSTIKKAYLDNELRDDPFYVDYNLLFNNIDMLMALSYSNEMKTKFIWTNSADFDNAQIISNTFEYDYREEMDMDMVDYEVSMDKFLFGMWAVIWEWNEETNSPHPICWPAEYCRPDPQWRWHINRYRYIWRYGKMTKHEMKNAWDFFNIDDVTDTDRSEKEWSDKGNNGSWVTQKPDNLEDDSAYFWIYNHFRTNDDWKKCLVTLANGGKTLIRYIELDYEVWGKPVFPISLDTWKPKRWFPMWVKLYDLAARKQRVLSLLLNLAVKKAVRSSLGNHIIVDEKAVKNKQQLNQLTEFPEVILVDTENWKKNTTNVVTELQRSQVPADNYNTDDRIKQLNYEETSIWPNQLWISPAWNQTATEIKDNAQNSNIRLSLANRISLNYYKDFAKKWFMMYVYHLPKDTKKEIIISREYWDKYLTFEHKYLTFSSDPHVKVMSKFDIEQKNKQLFTNHVVLHSYIQQLASQPYVALEIRMSMRQSLRLLWYNEEEILTYVRESAEEQEAKWQLYLLNRDEALEKLTPDQLEENHEDYLQVYKQAKETKATKSAVNDRIQMQKKRDIARRKQMLLQQQQNPQQPNTNGMNNQMTSNMINQQNSWWQPNMKPMM